VKKVVFESGSIQVKTYCDINNEVSHVLWEKSDSGISPVKHANGTITGSFVTYRL